MADRTVGKRKAVLLSTLFYPGVGQLFQRRFLAAAVFALLFMACAVVLAASAGRIILCYYSLPERQADTLPTLPVVPLLASLAGAVLTWLCNLADAALADRRVPRPPAG
jgi:hypothetical protein